VVKRVEDSPIAQAGRVVKIGNRSDNIAIFKNKFLVLTMGTSSLGKTQRKHYIIGNL
jgi:hypothetical protein